MDIEREKEILEIIVKAINSDKYGMKRFLQATPYVEHDYYSFNGIINEKIFYQYLYYESNEVK